MPTWTATRSAGHSPRRSLVRGTGWHAMALRVRLRSDDKACPTVIPALANLVAASVMAGVIWFVQIVHYPLFASVGTERSINYAVDNQRRTSWVVGLPMAVEGVSAIALFVVPPSGVGRMLPLLSGMVLAIVLVSTIAAQVPQHARLARSSDADEVADAVRRLVRSNWVRTIGWSLRAVLGVIMVSRVA